MRRFACEVCSTEVFFDSTECLHCGAELGYHYGDDEIIALESPTADVTAGAGRPRYRCSQAALAHCSWVVDTAGAACASCSLTRTRPADADLEGLTLFPVAEAAKRHLLRDLRRVGFAVDDVDDSEHGLAFDLLSSVDDDVTIGHADGVITMDLAEGDDSHREKVRQRLAEPYRTMLGHFRHEVGHYIEWRLLERTGRMLAVRELFGDERADYQAAIDRHYRDGSPENWQQSFISEYATMHPYEDFAESWAHYLHIEDTLETARAFDLVADPAEASPSQDFGDVVRTDWLPFATAMNVVNRSLGARDLYPFTVADPVVEKLRFAASVVRSAETPTHSPAPEEPRG
ncbi:putative zinc-binding metallopeptidase [Herbiconiux sp. KACC 21604]|uniref:zinc-binding metallopeptidase family protein n=1 Tax=unclassified Herbiconiux TaxID=2618217 RepID=UPI0014924062|nr:putative zinc-binding metallopeptidase [Herbiconiux sp. SALV-R1]QJU54229.1 hypothetical protein HL652_11775 [Herbiconiux sp. SALV-R1]WPO85290.1 putative zinc-binding metallopeptidase [Herbiconiux sp. KACC 21604]